MERILSNPEFENRRNDPAFKTYQEQPKTPEEIFNEFWEQYENNIEADLKDRDDVTLEDEKKFSQALIKGINWDNIASPTEENPQPNMLFLDMVGTIKGDHNVRPSLQYLMPFIQNQAQNTFQFQVLSTDSSDDISYFLSKNNMRLESKSLKDFDSVNIDLNEDFDINMKNVSALHKLTYIQDFLENSILNNITLIDDDIEIQETFEFDLNNKEVNITLIPSPRIEGKKE